MQRAINAGGEAVCYGENFFMMEKLPQTLGDLARNLPQRMRSIDGARQALLVTPDHDLSSLFPDYSPYLALVRQQFEALLAQYQSDATALGRTRWAIKSQVVQLQSFAYFMRMVPNARYVFVYRDILDAAPSVKARFPRDVSDIADLTKFGRRWAENSVAMRAMTGENILHVEHATIASTETIARIEAHLGCALHRGTFATKKNVSPHRDQLVGEEVQTHYRAPATLSEEEMSALLGVTSAARSSQGYAAI